MSSRRLPDLVRDSRLDTEFRNGLTIHSYTASGAHRRIEKERVHWEKVKEIGKGGFGSVHLESRRGSLAGDQPNVRAVKRIRHANHQNWVHELEAVAKFSNKQYEYCFVKSFGWYEFDDSLYIAMEYLPSGDLYAFISNGTTLSESESQDITYQILEGLFLMHDNGFTHRDLKPQNILVKGSPPDPWWVKIADFGISKRIEDESVSASTVKGTLEFMAPELFNSRRKGESSAPPDIFAADIWAVGCMAFLMLTGSTPFPSLRELMFYSGNKEELPTSLLEHQASSIAQDFIGSLLAHIPAQRPKAEDALDHAWIAHLSMDANGELSAGEDLEPAIRAQGQPENHTATFWTEEMQTWTTKPLGVTLSQGANNAIHRSTDEIPHTSAAYRKPIPGIKDIETDDLNGARDSQRQQIRKESTAAELLRRFSTRRRKSPSRPFPPPAGPAFANPTDGYVSRKSFSRSRSSLDRIYQYQPPQPDPSLTNTPYASQTNTAYPSQTNPPDPPLTNYPDIHIPPRRSFSVRRSRLDRDIPSSSTLNVAETSTEKPVLLPPIAREVMSLRRAAGVDGKGFTRKGNSESTYEPAAPPSSSHEAGNEDYHHYYALVGPTTPNGSSRTPGAKSLGHARQESIQTRWSRQEAIRQRDSFSEEKTEDSLAPNNDEDEVALKPVYLRGLFGVSMTSSKPLPIIKAEIIRVLKQLRIYKEEIKGGFRCTHIWDPPWAKLTLSFQVIFEIFVVKVPFIHLHGLQFKRVEGSVMVYKDKEQEILGALGL